MSKVFSAIIAIFFGLAWAASGYAAATSTVSRSGQALPDAPRSVMSSSAVNRLVWLEQKVAASDGGVNESFGLSVAVSGNVAIIGAPGANALVQGESGTGAAYVFSKLDGVWSEVQKLVPSDGKAGDIFGSSVAIDGDTALIGAANAPCDNTNGYCDSGPGVVYVFTKSGGKWSQTQKLTASDGVAYDRFGNINALALSGDTAFVGAPFAHQSATIGGRVYVFTRSGNVWTQTQELAPEADNYGSFGAYIDFDGTTAVIGRPAYGADKVGAAYVYMENDGSWERVQKLTASASGTVNYLFPKSVAVEGNTVLLGRVSTSTSDNEIEYSVHVYTLASGVWSHTQRLTADTDTPGADYGFGQSVAVYDNTAVITAPYATVGDNLQQGRAFVFYKSNGSWHHAFKLNNGSYLDQFGADSVGLDGDTMLIGAYQWPHDGSVGAVYFYTASDLGLAVDAPESIGPGGIYLSQTLVTNNSSEASAYIKAIIPVPAAASFVFASASQGDCSFASGAVACNLGSIAGNAGVAKADVTLKAIQIAPGSVHNVAYIAKATPSLSASMATAIVENDNNAPVANDSTLNTDKNKAASGTLSATDPDGDSLTFAIVVQPANGTVKLADASTGSYTYTPNKGFSGNDNFAFTASDGQATSNVATVSVTVKNTSSGGGGGLGWFALVALLGLMVPALMRRKRTH